MFQLEGFELGVYFVLGRSLRFGIRSVGICAFTNGFEDTCGVPFGKFDFLKSFVVRVAPFAGEVKERSRGVECVCSLPVELSASNKIYMSHLAPEHTSLLYLHS